MKNLAFLIVSLFTSVSLGNNFFNGDYDDLWKEVKKMERKQPQSAYKIIEQIYIKAKKENREDHLIKAILYKLKLRPQFEDLDPAAYAQDLESELDVIESQQGKAILSSYLSHVYYNYGMQNLYRYSNRTTVQEGDSDLPFATLEDIQQKSWEHLRVSLSSIDNSNDVSDIKVLLKEQSYDFSLAPETVGELLLLQALTFMTSAHSLVTIPEGSFEMAGQDIFTKDYEVASLGVLLQQNADPKAIAMALFNKADGVASLHSRQKILLDLMRLDYINQNGQASNKTALYISALENLSSKWGAQTGYEAIQLKLMDKYIQRGRSYKSDLSAEYEDGFIKADSLLQKLKKNSTDAVFKTKIRDAESVMDQAEIEGALEQVYLSEESIMAYLKFRNIKKVVYNIYRLSDETYKQFNEQYDQSSRKSIIEKLEATRTVFLDLPDSNDKNYHALEYAIEPLNYGRYILAIKDNSEGKKSNDLLSINIFHVSDLSYVFSSSGQGFVTDRKSGDPLPDVTIDVQSSNYDRGARRSSWQSIETLKSDPNGKFHIKAKERNFKFKLTKGADILDIGQNLYVNRQYDGGSEYAFTHLFTDRSIYRPGQSLHFKGLTVSKHGSIGHTPNLVVGQKVVVSLKDPNYQPVGEIELTTNEYGAISGSFILPEAGLTGNYHLQARSNQSGSSYANISVEEYKRPKIYGEFKDSKENFKLGDTVIVDGLVKSFSGADISGAKIKYRVERQEVRWRYECYIPWGPRVVEQVAHGQSSSEKDGTFKILFPTKVNGKGYGRDNYAIIADVTSPTGETTTLRKNIYLSNRLFDLVMEIPEGFFEGALKELQVKALNSEGKEVEVELAGTIEKLEDLQKFKRNRYWGKTDLGFLPQGQFKEIFPEDRVQENSTEELNVVQKILTRDEMTSKDLFEEINKLSQGSYTIKLTGTSKTGQSVTEDFQFNVSSNEGSAHPSKALWISDVPSVASPGDKLDLVVNTPYQEANIYYSINYRNSADEFIWKRLAPASRIDILIDESHRGGVEMQVILVKENRIYEETIQIDVPWTNKELAIEYVTFRDLLEPGVDETWSLKISDKDGESINGELLAAMYDASLDEFKVHNWGMDLYPKYRNRFYRSWSGYNLAWHQTYLDNNRPHFYFHIDPPSPRLDDFGTWHRFGRQQQFMKRGGAEMDAVMIQGEAPAPAAAMQESVATDSAADGDLRNQAGGAQAVEESSSNSFSIRENLNELVFFYPEVQVVDGKAEIKFKMNEALTKWKLMLLAHDKELKYVIDTKDIITQKKLMIEPFLPRFLRQGDELTLTSRVTNFSDKEMSVGVKLEILDAITQEPLDGFVDAIDQKVTLSKDESQIISWKLNVPQKQLGNVLIRTIADGGEYQDGEQNLLPVVTDRMLVTETMAINLKGGAKELLEFDALNKIGTSKTLEPQNMQLEFTNDPAWMVLKSMPYLLEGSKPTTTRLFNAYFSSQLMKDLLMKKPHLKQAIENWKAEDLKSSLSEKQDLKISDINTTPWMDEALSEEEQMAYLKLYVDENIQNQKIESVLQKFLRNQSSNGGFSWTKGGRLNWYITLNILEGIGQLNKINVETGIPQDKINSAISFIDNELVSHYNRRGNKKLLSSTVIHYLYVRSMFVDSPMSNEVSRIKDHYLELAIDKWPDHRTYMQAMLALSARVYKVDKLSKEIITSLKERMIQHDELGNYWNDQAGYYWYDLNIEKQALMIELFEEFDEDQETIDALRLFLLQNRRTNSWPTTKATAAACYAFLIGSDTPDLGAKPIVASLPMFYEKEVVFDSKKYNDVYQVANWEGDIIDSQLGSIRVNNPNEHVVWGGAYFQYWEDMDKVEAHSGNPLVLNKQIYKVTTDDRGESMQEINDATDLVPGDRIRIKITLSADRPMEFVELMDMRGSGTEPTSVLSQYKWQDGLGYYESTKDLASHFYIDFLPKGNFVFEYDVVATHQGNYSGGIAWIQSAFAPEFNAHSSGGRITITNE